MSFFFLENALNFSVSRILNQKSMDSIPGMTSNIGWFMELQFRDVFGVGINFLFMDVICKHQTQPKNKNCYHSPITNERITKLWFEK